MEFSLTWVSLLNMGMKVRWIMSLQKGQIKGRKKIKDRLDERARSGSNTGFAVWFWSLLTLSEPWFPNLYNEIL